MGIPHPCRRVRAVSTAITFICLLLMIGGGALGLPTSPHPEGSVRMTMEALHASGGVPPGWKFSLPQGDAESGLEVFIEMQCYVCHMVQGVTFPTHPIRREPGPDLTGMGAHHPASYFAESIVNPNTVIVTGTGYTDSDGRSRMPEYREMTLGQLFDLVAYLTSLQEPGAHKHHGSSSHSEKPVKGHSQGTHGHGSHHKTR